MQFTTAAEAAKLIRSHSSVYIQGSTSIPEVLVQAMTERADELTDVKIYSDRKSTRLNSSHTDSYRMPSSA